jgi:alkylation response protein AidB-like acyl-CoA dehydrogenase
MTLAVQHEPAGLVALAEQLAAEKFGPRAAAHDREGTFPVENYADLAASGLLAMSVPRAYGGLGVDTRTSCQILRAIARHCASTALTFNMHCCVVQLLDQLASAEQKARYFGGVVERGEYFASLVSEPESSFRGQFTFSCETRPVAGGYRVRGTKHFCSLSEAAHYYLVRGTLPGTTDLREGLVYLMVPRTAEGIERLDDWDTLGMRATSSHSVRFHDVFVADTDCIAAPGAAIRQEATARFVIGYASVYLGVAEAAYAFTVDYARTKTFKPDPSPLSHDPMVQRTVAEMRIAVDTAAMLLRAAAEARDEARDAAGVEQATLLENEAKYVSAETAVRVTDLALKVVGGRGYFRSLPLERYVRDARGGIVMPPATETILAFVGKRALGLEAKAGLYRQ